MGVKIGIRGRIVDVDGGSMVARNGFSIKIHRTPYQFDRSIVQNIPGGFVFFR